MVMVTDQYLVNIFQYRYISKTGMVHETNKLNNLVLRRS